MVEYDEVEYGGLPVKYAVFSIILCTKVIHMTPAGSYNRRVYVLLTHATGFESTMS